MTVRAWLHQRSPIPPPRLVERIDEALGDRGDRQSSETPEQCISAAAELLRDLLARPTAGRESALELLTVDALVTYAFEAAAKNVANLPQCADAAMARLVAATQ